MPDVLAALKADNYRMGSCRIIEYDPQRVDVFGPHFLYDNLYRQCLESRPGSKWGILPDACCGMRNLLADAICAYWSTRKIVVCAVDDPTEPCGFKTAGMGYATIFVGSQPGTPDPCERAMVGAYVFFKPFWGTPEIRVLSMLGLAYFFTTYNLTAIHGQRYSTNALTARFMSQFGFRDTGLLPRFLGHVDGTIRDCALSTLLREDFVKYVMEQLLTLAPPNRL
jgi:RimJ/RimL family protein N-acetyltransferase